MKTTKVTITVDEAGQDYRFRPGLNDNRLTERVWKAGQKFAMAVRACQQAPHTKEGIKWSA